MGKRFLLVSLMALVFTMFLTFGSEAQAKKQLTLYYVDHSTSASWFPFWPEYYRGIKEASEMLAPFGVEVKHLNSSDDVNTQIALLKKAVAANPDGLVLSMADPKSFEPILKPLVEKGVPIMAANVEDPRPIGQRIPYLTYYGEDAGRTGADLANAVIKYVKQSGGKKPQFALLYASGTRNPIWEARFQKFGEVLAQEYGAKNENIVSGDTGEFYSYLAKNPKVDVICAHAYFIHQIVGLLPSMGKTAGKDVYLASVDLMPEVLKDIKDGTVVATSDEQEYLQGFLPLMDLYLYLTKSKVHPLDSVFTGPMIWDRNNVDGVLQEMSAGYR